MAKVFLRQFVVLAVLITLISIPVVAQTVTGTMNWTGGFQYEFSGSWLAELIYQGTAGVGLLNNWDINVVPLHVSTDTTCRRSWPGSARCAIRTSVSS